jgi:hypothetical protein
MRISHPWSWVPQRRQAGLFAFELVLTLLVLLALQATGGPLRTEAAPAGIVSFELAGNDTLSQEILRSWGPTGRIYAGLNLGLDYLFLFAYATAIGLACAMIGQKGALHPWLRSLGISLSWALLLAGAFDAIENYALIRLLLGSTGGGWSIAARFAAIAKFSLVVLGILYVILAGLAGVLLRLRPERGRSPDHRPPPLSGGQSG